MATNPVSGGVPKATGGYNYSTDKQENTLFNQGLVPGDPGAPQQPYDYSAKGRAQRMYQRTGNSPVAVPSSYDYSTTARKAYKIKHHGDAINRK